MLSYKEYKLLNESLYGVTPLGIAKPTNLGIMGANLSELEEGTKKKKKYMSDLLDDEDPDVEDLGDDLGDDDMGDEPDVDLDDEDEGMDGEGGCGGKHIEFCKKMMKKHMKKEWCGKEKYTDKEGPEPDYDDMSDLKEKPKKKSKKDKDKDKVKFETLTQEDKDWWASVKNMLNSDPQPRNWDGISVQEDQLIPPANDGMVYRQPSAGEPGFAPQQRVGDFNFTPADSGWKYNS